MERCPSIDNLQNHSAEVVNELKDLLLTGAPVFPDARRPNFYDLHGPKRTFFIHISPTRGRVILLTMWERLTEPAFRCLEPVIDNV
jgi:hypothetical protein